MISPLLANIYLHWFDHSFHQEGGPAEYANAKLVRYADDFLVMARYQGDRLTSDVGHLIEDRLELKLNREKTEIVDLEQPGEKLDFLGYSYECRGGKVRMSPAKESVNAERRALKEKLRKIVVLGEVIEPLNRHLIGWARYFSLGECNSAIDKINSYVRERIRMALDKTSQRPYKLPEGTTLYQHLKEKGLVRLSKKLLYT